VRGRVSARPFVFHSHVRPMHEIQYRPGDSIVLKHRSLGSIEPRGSGQIVAVLPETRGAVRYRVRLNNENFDRNIGHDDIDAEASIIHRPDSNTASARDKGGSSWIDLSIIKAKK
jgi:hypothetical protein